MLSTTADIEAGGDLGGGHDPNWQHGGPRGKTFYNSWVELIPECIVVETEAKLASGRVPGR